MIQLRLVGNSQVIGELSEAELAQLIDALEEEHGADRDYYIDADTLAHCEAQGVSARVLTMLAAVLGEQDGMDIEWGRG